MLYLGKPGALCNLGLRVRLVPGTPRLLVPLLHFLCVLCPTKKARLLVVDEDSARMVWAAVGGMGGGEELAHYMQYDHRRKTVHADA